MILKIIDKIFNLVKKLKIKVQVSKLKYIGKDVIVKDDVMFINPSYISIDNYSMIGERCYLRGGEIL